MTDKREAEFFSVATAVRVLPWALVGFLIIAGGLSSLFYGLPWARQTDVDKLAAVVSTDHDDLETISKTQAVAATEQNQIAAILTQLQSDMRSDQNATQENSLHIEGLEADEKAREAHEMLHRRGDN